MSFETPMVRSEDPTWAPIVTKLVKNASAFDGGEIKGIMRKLCLRFVRVGSIENFGEMQEYLRESKAPMQLIATPFKRPKGSSLRCIDMQTLAPRDHWLDVALGEREIAAKFGTIGRSHDVNEAVLAHMTGTLVEMMPADDVLPGPFSAYEIPLKPTSPTRVLSVGARLATCTSLIRIVA